MLRTRVDRYRTLLACSIVIALVRAGAAPLGAADCNENGLEDSVEIAAGAVPDCDRSSVPDECELDGPLLFPEPAELAVSSRRSLALGDFDRDGDTDLVAAGPTGIMLFLGAGRGFNGASRTIRSGSAAGVQALDLDGDGDLDIGALLFKPGIRVLLAFNDGFGLFRDMVEVLFHTDDLDERVRSFALADLDLDGRRDLVVPGPFALAIRRGEGGTVFGDRSLLPVGSGPIDVIAVDLDGDADPDLVTANELDNVSIHINDGAGAFSSARNIFVAGATAVASIDFDRDGRPEVVAGGADGVTLARNLGGGRFADPVVSGSAPVRGLAVTDVDGDGESDLVTASEDGIATVYWNEGRSALSGRTASFVGDVALSVAAADVVGDGRVDLVVGRSPNRPLAVLEGEGRRRLVGVPALSIRASDLLVADLDGDGNRDLIALRDVQSSIGLFFTGDDLTVESVVDLGTGTSPLAAQSVDIDGDADRDILAVRREARSIAVFRNDGNRVFSRSADVPLRHPADSIASGDWDGDGDVDVAVTGVAAVVPLLNEGARGFTPSIEVPVRWRPFRLETADLNGDGDVDIVTTNLLTKAVAVLINAGGGRFASSSEVPVGGVPQSLEVADLTGEGYPDVAVVVGDLRSRRLVLLGNDGVAGLEEVSVSGVALGSGTSAGRVATGDVTGDGLADVVTPDLRLLENGGGQRFAEVGSADAVAPGFVRLFDLNGNGRLDVLAIGEPPVGGVVMHLNPRLVDCDGNGVPDSCEIADGSAADCNGNGVPDACDRDCDGNGVPDDCDVAAGRQPDCNGNGVPDGCDIAAGRSADANTNGIPDGCEGAVFHRGDPNDNGLIEIGDAIELLNALFLTGRELGCADAGDANDDGRLNVADALFVLRHLFLGGPPPPPPGPPPLPCGLDPVGDAAPDELDCESYVHCVR